jgi:DNA-binding GntR family transcriptional regulator
MPKPSSVAPATELSVVDRVIQSIVKDVREGRLVAGQRLVEADFTLRLGVSRSVVREAFQRLMADGLLKMERHRGVSIKETTPEDFDNIFAVRAVLEGLAARLATPALKAAPAELLACHARLTEAVLVMDVHQFIALNHSFHDLIVQAANNPVLSDACRRLGNTIHQVEAKTIIQRQVMLDSVKEHQAIIDAILRGDPEAAAASAEAHQHKAAVAIRSLQEGTAHERPVAGARR